MREALLALPQLTADDEVDPPASRHNSAVQEA
jgi:hypothetical protein